MAGGSFVGLDIGSSLIKVAEMRRSGGGIEVTAIGMAPTPQEAVENSLIVDPQMLGQAVKNLLRQAGVSAKQCVSSVSCQSAVVVRVLPDVPKMSPAELADTMKWEVERQVPFAASEVIMDYQPIDREDSVGDNIEVLLAVAQQDFIDRHVEVLFQAGLKPFAIDIEALAVGRSLLELGENGAAPGHTVAVLNIGASNTDINIFRDRLLTFPRTLPIAGDHLTRAISQGLMVDMATAENYKRDLGEVLMGQMAPQAQPDFGGSLGGPGFMDFTAPASAEPEAAAGSPGRVPFDFSQPGGAPPATPSPFESAPPPAPTPFDFTTAGGAEQETMPSIMPAGVDPAGAPYAAEPGFGQVPAGNLPLPTSGGDLARDTLRVQVFNAMAPVLAELSQELRRSIDYFRGRSADSMIHEILLVGGTAKLRNLAPFLEQELGIPTRVADPLSAVRVSSKNFSSGHLGEISSLFPVSVGLGARDLISAPAAAKKKRR